MIPRKIATTLASGISFRYLGETLMSEDPFCFTYWILVVRLTLIFLVVETLFCKIFLIFFNKFSFKKSGLSCDLIQTEFC